VAPKFPERPDAVRRYAPVYSFCHHAQKSFVTDSPFCQTTIFCSGLRHHGVAHVRERVLRTCVGSEKYLKLDMPDIGSVMGCVELPAAARRARRSGFGLFRTRTWFSSHPFVSGLSQFRQKPVIWMAQLSPT
jgi:hypothetical protein